MADQILKLPADGTNTGRNLDASELTVGSNVVERERINIADPAIAAAIAQILNAAPSGSEYGLVVRPILMALPSGTNVIGHVIVDSVGGTVDIADRSGRLVGHVNVDNFPSTYDVSDRSARLLGHVAVDSQGAGLALDASLSTLHTDLGLVAKDATVSGVAKDATLVPIKNQFSPPLITGFPSTNPINTSGDNTVYTPTSGKSIRLKWLYMATLDTNSASVIAKVRFSTQSNAQAFYTAVMGKPGIFSHKTVRESQVNDTMIINLSVGGQPVYVSFDIEEF